MIVLIPLYDPGTPPAPFVGPPSEQFDSVEGVRQRDFLGEDRDYDEAYRLWLIELNRLVNAGCEIWETQPEIGGSVALMDCRQEKTDDES